MLRHHSTYEIMRPEEVGFGRTRLVLGKHSGRHAFRQRLQDLGIRLESHELECAFEEFKRLADARKGQIVDADLEALARQASEPAIQLASSRW